MESEDIYHIEYNNFNSMDELEKFFNDNPHNTKILIDGIREDIDDLEMALLTIRDIRDTLLQKSDIYFTLTDYPISEEKKEEWRIYRQTLRDIPENITEGGFIIFDHNTQNYLFKEGFSWPTPPSP